MKPQRRNSQFSGYNFYYTDSFHLAFEMLVCDRRDGVDQCFSTAGPRSGTGPWHQLYRAARNSPGIDKQFKFNFIFVNMPHRKHKCTNNLYDYAIIINTYVSLLYELKKKLERY